MVVVLKQFSSTKPLELFLDKSKGTFSCTLQKWDSFQKDLILQLVGNYKLVKFNDNDEVMLFDLESDYHELSDLSLEQPEKTRAFEQILNEYLTMRTFFQNGKEGIT